MQGCSGRALTTSVQLNTESSALTALPTVPSHSFSPAADCEQQQQAVKVAEVQLSSDSVPHALHPVLVPLLAKYKARQINGPVLHLQVLSPHSTSPCMVQCLLPTDIVLAWAKCSGMKSAYVFQKWEGILAFLIVFLKLPSPSQHLRDPSGD